VKPLSVAFLTQDFLGPQTFSINYYVAMVLHMLAEAAAPARVVVYSHRGSEYSPRSPREVLSDYAVGPGLLEVEAFTRDAFRFSDASFLTEFDVVICTMYWWGDVLADLVSRRGRGAPRIIYWLPSILMHEYVTNHHHAWPRMDLMFDLQKKCVQAADHVVFNSRADRERGYGYFGSTAHEKSSVTYPVSLPCTVATTQHHVGLRRRFGFAGRWEYRKGAHLLVEAFFRRYCRHRSDTLVLFSDLLDHDFDPAVALDASAARKLEKLMAAGAVEMVRWRSSRNEYLQALAGCDVLAVPSLYDPFNMVAYDAIALGIPTVLSRFCGVEEIVAAAHPRVVKINPWDLDEFDAALEQMARAAAAELRVPHAHDLALDFTCDSEEMTSATLALLRGETPYRAREEGDDMSSTEVIQ